MEENIHKLSILSLFVRKCLQIIVLSNLRIGHTPTASKSWMYT